MSELTQSLLELAGSHASAGAWREAEASAEAAAALDPDRHEAHVLHAVALAKQDKHERAIEAFERAVALQPGDVASLTNMGELLLELGAYQQAAGVLRRAMSADPKAEHPSGRRARSLVAKTLGKLK